MTKKEKRTVLRNRLTEAATNVAGILARVGKLEVLIGIELANVRDTFAEAKAAGVSFAKTPGIMTDDWRVVARELVPGRSVATLYRWCNAGAVARIIGPVGNADTGSLVPLYRILNEAANGTPEEREAAAALVREAYAEAVKEAGEAAPKEAAVLAIAERIAPTTKGKAAGTAASSKESAAEDAEDAEDEDDAEDAGDESRRESAESLVVADAAAVEAASGPVNAIRGQWTRELVGRELTQEGLLAIMLGTVRLVKEHGPGTIAAVLSAAPKGK